MLKLIVILMILFNTNLRTACGEQIDDIHDRANNLEKCLTDPANDNPQFLEKVTSLYFEFEKHIDKIFGNFKTIFRESGCLPDVAKLELGQGEEKEKLLRNIRTITDCIDGILAPNNPHRNKIKSRVGYTATILAFGRNWAIQMNKDLQCKEYQDQQKVSGRFDRSEEVFKLFSHADNLASLLEKLIDSHKIEFKARNEPGIVENIQNIVAVFNVFIKELEKQSGSINEVRYEIVLKKFLDAHMDMTTFLYTLSGINPKDVKVRLKGIVTGIRGFMMTVKGALYLANEKHYVFSADSMNALLKALDNLKRYITESACCKRPEMIAINNVDTLVKALGQLVRHLNTKPKNANLQQIQISQLKYIYDFMQNVILLVESKINSYPNIREIFNEFRKIYTEMKNCLDTDPKNCYNNLEVWIYKFFNVLIEFSKFNGINPDLDDIYQELLYNYRRILKHLYIDLQTNGIFKNNLNDIGGLVKQLNTLVSCFETALKRINFNEGSLKDAFVTHTLKFANELYKGKKKLEHLNVTVLGKNELVNLIIAHLLAIINDLQTAESMADSTTFKNWLATNVVAIDSLLQDFIITQLENMKNPNWHQTVHNILLEYTALLTDFKANVEQIQLSTCTADVTTSKNSLLLQVIQLNENVLEQVDNLDMSDPLTERLRNEIFPKFMYLLGNFLHFIRQHIIKSDQETHNKNVEINFPLLLKLNLSVLKNLLSQSVENVLSGEANEVFHYYLNEYSTFFQKLDGLLKEIRQEQMTYSGPGQHGYSPRKMVNLSDFIGMLLGKKKKEPQQPPGPTGEQTYSQLMLQIRAYTTEVIKLSEFFIGLKMGESMWSNHISNCASIIDVLVIRIKEYVQYDSVLEVALNRLANLKIRFDDQCYYRNYAGEIEIKNKFFAEIRNIEEHLLEVVDALRPSIDRYNLDTWHKTFGLYLDYVRLLHQELSGLASTHGKPIKQMTPAKRISDETGIASGIRKITKILNDAYAVMKNTSNGELVFNLLNKISKYAQNRGHGNTITLVKVKSDLGQHIRDWMVQVGKSNPNSNMIALLKKVLTAFKALKT